MRDVTKWLVCGGRDFTEEALLRRVLDALVTERGKPELLIEGGANGADTLAGHWADSRGIHVVEVRANWDAFGKRAGYLRNAAMLYLQPSLVVAFPGGRGTQMMIDLARDAQVEVVHASQVR